MLKSGTIERKLALIEQEMAKLRGLPRSDSRSFNRRDTLRKRRKKLAASLMLVKLVEERKAR